MSADLMSVDLDLPPAVIPPPDGSFKDPDDSSEVSCVVDDFPGVDVRRSTDGVNIRPSLERPPFGLNCAYLGNLFARKLEGDRFRDGVFYDEREFSGTIIGWHRGRRRLPRGMRQPQVPALFARPSWFLLTR